MTTVTDMEFKRRVSYFIDEPSQEPVYITKHGKRVAALINAVELERRLALFLRSLYFFKKGVAIVDSHPERAQSWVNLRAVKVTVVSFLLVFIGNKVSSLCFDAPACL